MIPRLLRSITSFALALSLLAASTICIADDSTLIDEGRQIYRTTTRTDGTPVKALVQGDVPLPATAAACTNCHRRSGFGISEGGSRSLNLTAPALFSPADKPPARAAYNDATLIRAIAAGIAADGRTLDATMPRYELGADDAAALIAYLKTLGQAAPDGLTDTDIVVATVIAENAPPAEQEAVRQVLRHYVELKNSESRRESERAAASNRHAYGRSRQRAFRAWRLQVWTLKGRASSWPEQLAANYARDKPFVIVSGTAGKHWREVHEFCEKVEVPCLLPLSESPVGDNTDFYSLYFSTGATLEARVTADHLARRGLPVGANIVIAHDGDDSSEAAAGILKSALAEHGFDNVSLISHTRSKALSQKRWRSILLSNDADAIVAWLPMSSISTLADALESSGDKSRFVYTSHAYSDWFSDELQFSGVSANFRHVYPYALPQKDLAQFPRESLWLKQHGLAALDPVAASKVLYSCRVLGMGLADIQSNFSREYLLETLEHALDGTQLTSVFPKTSLGPDQRLLSRGAYVVEPTQYRDGKFANAEWVQP